MWTVGKISDDDDLKKVGGTMFGVALDAGAEGIGALTLNPSAPALAKGIKTFADSYNVVGNVMDTSSSGMADPRTRAQFATHVIKNAF